MSIYIFSLAGYSHLYRSLIRFCHLNVSVAKDLVYRLNTSNLDSARLAYPNRRITEITPFAFSRCIEQFQCRPYRTEVQLYKALLALDTNIIREAITDDQREAVAQMHCIMSNIESRFYKTFGADIFDMVTVYGICSFGLVPWDDEPSVCMLADWLLLPSA